MTDEILVLRKATMGDAERLLLWRNDPETRAYSKSHTEVSREEHMQWLAKTFSGDTSRLLYVAEIEGEPVGTVRGDHREDGAMEISYTVAPEARGKGVAKRMVLQFVKEVVPPNTPLVAHIQKGHVPSERVAEAIGLHPVSKVLPEGTEPLMVEWR